MTIACLTANEKTQMEMLITSAGPVSYLDTGGKGFPIFFVHGNSCSSRSFHKLIPLLYKQFRIIAVDLPGHGQSPSPLDPKYHYTIPGYASILEEIAALLKIKKCGVLGYSLGGNIALQWSQFTDKIAGIVLLSCAPMPYSEEAKFYYLPYEGSYAAHPETLTKMQAETYMEAVGFDVSDPDAICMVEDAMKTDPASRAVMVASVLGGQGKDELTIVEQLPLPLAMIAGENDKVLNLKLLTELPYQNLWKGEIFLIKNSSHALPIHQAKEIMPLLVEFFSQLAMKN